MRLWVCSSQRSQRQKGAGWHHCPPWLNTADNIKTWILVVASFFTKISTISRRLINKSQYQSQGAGVQRARQKPQLKTRRSTLHFWLFWSALAYRLCYIDLLSDIVVSGRRRKKSEQITEGVHVKRDFCIWSERVASVYVPSCFTSVEFSVDLLPHGLLGARIPGHPLRLSHSSWALTV